MNTTIVIPATDLRGEKNKNQLERLLESIVEGGYTEAGFNVDICYDSCDDRVFVNHFREKFPQFEHNNQRGNRLNFARNSNLGLRRTFQRGRNALLVNQDTILPDRLVFLNTNKTIKGVPDNILKSDIIFTANSCQLEEERVDLAVLELFKLSSPGFLEEIKTKFPFYCVFIGHKVMEEIGFLDGVYIATFEDDDYITRALLKGFKVYRSGVRVYHEGSHINTRGEWESASGSYNQERLNINLMKYMTKFQINADEVRTDEPPHGIDHSKLIPWILKERSWENSMKVE